MLQKTWYFDWKGQHIDDLEKLFSAAMACLNKDEAAQFTKVAVNAGTPHDILMKNLGYIAGFYTQKEMDRLHELFGAVHPVFGTKFPSPAQAFKMGTEAGKKLREGKG